VRLANTIVKLDAKGSVVQSQFPSYSQATRHAANRTDPTEMKERGCRRRCATKGIGDSAGTRQSVNYLHCCQNASLGLYNHNAKRVDNNRKKRQDISTFERIRTSALAERLLMRLLGDSKCISSTSRLLFWLIRTASDILGDVDSFGSYVGVAMPVVSRRFPGVLSL
jgi:hypothetical protein